ncbi:unnamed protein product [Sphenostylis stenocarpa]|uniref:Uncharacterized protein n=1 Tax=Sphenostylis stenocarpa TaxID=92480 RepID=A0AA86VNZ5_9FABA|nr:unnamed protein product [Sphenostylis stenocarpa]
MHGDNNLCVTHGRSQKTAPRQPLHGHLRRRCGCAPVWSPINVDPWFVIRWIFAGGHQLRCDLVPPTACLVSCRRNTPGCILGAPSSSPSACPTKSFVHIFSHGYGSYVVFHGCNLEAGSTSVVLHAWLR